MALAVAAISHSSSSLRERLDDDRQVFGLAADRAILSACGMVHGGMLTTFVDQAFGVLFLDSVDHRLCDTIQLNTSGREP